MLNLIEVLEFCGFEDAGTSEPFLTDSELWSGGPEVDVALGVSDGWSGWKGEVHTYWRQYGDCVPTDEVAMCIDRIVIIDRTRERYAITCRCEPNGCDLAAELVRAWFATGH